MFLRAIAVGCVAIALWATVSAAGQEFRVGTDVYVDDEKKPVSESLTLFTSDVVYDFLLKPAEEATIFDIRRGKLVLLDSQHQTKTSLTTGELAEFSSAIKVLGVQKGAVGLLQPQFDMNYDAEQFRVTLSSEWLTYKAKGVTAQHLEAAQRYRQFADWYARLNAIRPGSLPPFGRLELNQALAERGLLPQEIERTVVLDRPVAKKTLHAKSKHAIIWILSNTDRKRIEQAGRDLANFQEIEPTAYWQTPPQTARR
jgi:hypothetical protein